MYTYRVVCIGRARNVKLRTKGKEEEEEEEKLLKEGKKEENRLTW